MPKQLFNKPVVIMLYGLPGSGKSTLARNLTNLLGVTHINGDRLRYELFDNPSYSRDEQAVINNLMTIMAEDYLKAGMSIIYDANASRLQERKALRELAKKYKAETVLIWIQIDAESALARVKNRDPKKSDDQYSRPMSEEAFHMVARSMQNPYLSEPFLVISGKHLFASQKQPLLKKMHELNLLIEDAFKPKMAKPELVNLVSQAKANAGRYDLSRRNIMIN